MFPLERALRYAKPTTETRPVDFTDTWVNELKSIMTVRQNGNEITGDYLSQVSGEKDVKARGVLSGYVNGDLIAFVVRWDNFDAITSWVGQLAPDGGTLNMLWQMTKQAEAGEEWSSVNTGADAFRRTT